MTKPCADTTPLAGHQAMVLGAGVAGLACASALRLHGMQVSVLEQAPEISEVGAGLQISPNGMRVIHALGISPDEIGDAARAVELRNANGRLVTRLDLPQPTILGGTSPGFYLCHRADLIGALETRARALDVDIQLLQKIEHVELSGRDATLHTSVGARHHAQFVVGADGLHSVLRPALNGPAEPFFTGQVAWRAIIPGDDGPPVSQVFMGPGRHLVSYPLRGGKLRNIVAIQERSRWAAEGWNHPDDPDALREVFAGFGGPIPGWLAAVENLWLWGLFRHPVATNWHDPTGRVALVGDAAHPTLPFMAQGANMGLEDAWSLASEISRSAAQGDADFQSGLHRYADARAPRTRAIVKAANANARNYHLRGPLAPLAHQALRLGTRLAPGAALKRYGWIYDYDVTR